MTPTEAHDLADRTLAAIDASADAGDGIGDAGHAADRERVAFDLTGLRAHAPRWYTDEEPGFGVWVRDHVCPDPKPGWPCDDARRYADGLRRTARLYGVEA